MIKALRKNKFELLIKWTEKRNDKFYKIAWSYLYNHEDVEDMLQETILKAYEKIDTLKKENYFETWFTSILINECRQKLRKRKKEVLSDDIEIVGEHIDSYNFYEELNLIDGNFKEAIFLKYISGYSQEEIGEILDIPIGTVKSRIYRGLKAIRKEMKEVQL